jgi:hypothetical protein
MKKSKKRGTHFVPRVVFEAAFAGVVPVCVAATDCASSATGGPAPVGSASPPIGTSHFGVLNECFAGTTFTNRCGGFGTCLAPGTPCPGTVPVGSSSCGPIRLSDAGVADSGLDVLEASDAHGDGLMGGDVARKAFVPSDASEAGDAEQGDSAADVVDGDGG